MISSGVLGYCPSSALRCTIRWTDSVKFKYELPKGVKTGMMPWSKSQRMRSTV
jgi:hypothetical protein